jgi:hypothetical protein
MYGQDVVAQGPMTPGALRGVSARDELSRAQAESCLNQAAQTARPQRNLTEELFNLNEVISHNRRLSEAVVERIRGIHPRKESGDMIVDGHISAVIVMREIILESNRLLSEALDRLGPA